MKELKALLKPAITEKATSLAEKGQYVFVIPMNTTKVEVKKAVNEIYGAKVKSVKIVIIKPKTRLLAKRRTLTKRELGKKAIVTLRKGEKAIDVNKIKVKA